MKSENFVTVKISVVISRLERQVSMWLQAFWRYMLLPSSELRIETVGSFETLKVYAGLKPRRPESKLHNISR
jgi:hypothetical protein